MFYGKVCYKMNKDFFCDYYRMTGKKWADCPKTKLGSHPQT